MTGEDLVFTKKEDRGLVHPYYNVLFVTLQVTNHRIYMVLVDTRSSMNILLMDAWKQIKLQHLLQLMNTSL